MIRSLASRIPGIRTLLRQADRNRFNKAWRQRNPHNDTVPGERMFPLENVHVGRGTYGMLNVQSLFVQEGEQLHIGNFVSIAPGVQFLMGVNHQLETYTTFPFYSRLVERSTRDALVRGPIIIDDEVWLGTNALIMSGVHIGKGAIVAAGAIVTKDVPPYAIVGGNPARIIKMRHSPEVIEALLRIDLNTLSDAQIRANLEVIYAPIRSVEDVIQLKKTLFS
jgi:acetyltransferase-like isoleucine patch superfamily enzyme